MEMQEEEEEMEEAFGAVGGQGGSSEGWMLEKKRENEVRVETHVEVDKLKQRIETGV